VSPSPNAGIKNTGQKKQAICMICGGRENENHKFHNEVTFGMLTIAAIRCPGGTGRL
jgi:hypothetical protein